MYEALEYYLNFKIIAIFTLK